MSSGLLTKKAIPAEQRLVLHGVSWLTYQALLAEILAQQRPRIAYDNGQLEIMVPLPEHESYKRIIGRMIEATTEELGIEIRSLGSCTWSRADLARGIEADECYYIQHEGIVRGQMQLDLATDPPPDLVLEIDITSSSLNRIEIYKLLGVTEIWRFDGRELLFYVLSANGYQTVEQSAALPLLPRPEVLEMIQQASEMGETTWLKSVRQRIQRLIKGNRE
ncbi:Uma2 family endonuclease [Synechococcus sp. PCC 6312]|uniref:Uma2 family endonuclease n=1 Tax=Synechococcus sp. (strain ATCC 27167 / PCC 6312) TaxID=195253 RepID=UPI00029EE295|nr:Uma2 family endonuclease [Synechococcus sp. PCC 6312]AFY61367.1 hypothetical protein Syn6312_2252 [Synechococcus sp. PCC 6312]